jgi:hypothetical protein
MWAPFLCVVLRAGEVFQSIPLDKPPRLGQRLLDHDAFHMTVHIFETASTRGRYWGTATLVEGTVTKLTPRKQ